MIKRILSIAVLISLLAGCLSFSINGKEPEGNNYVVYWESDFDKGYSASDTAIKDFDKYTSTKVFDANGNETTPPSFWDGTYQYYNWNDKNFDYNARVVRRVENGNGMMSFQHNGTGRNYGIFVEKTLGNVDELIPELILEYKIRFTETEGKDWYIRQKAASSSNPANLQGPIFHRATGKINDYDSDNSDNITFEYGTAASPSSRWYTVRVVYSNSKNTRKTYIDGVYVGESSNHASASYYKNGKAAIRIEGIYLRNNTIIDIDDIKVMSECRLSSTTPKIMQNGVVVTEYEYSDEPVSASAEIINYADFERYATVYFAAYGYDADGSLSLVASDSKTEAILPGTKQTVITDGLVLPSGVADIKAFVWDHLTPLSQVATAEKAIFESSKNGMPEFNGFREIGNVSFSKKAGAATTGYTVDGLRTFIAMIGTPGYVYEFDTLTGKFISKHQSGSGLQHNIKIGSDGKVYTMPTGSPDLWVYDPATKENTLIKADICHGSSAWHMNYGANDDRSMLYLPVMSSDYVNLGTPVIEYDIDNKKINVYEGFDKGCKYAHCATGDENYVYVGSSDSNEVATISRMDKKTGEIVVYEDDQGRTPGAVWFVKIIGDLLFTRISSNIVVLDKNTMKKINEFEGGRGQYDCVSDPDPSNPDLVYFSSNHGSTLRSYNMKTNTVEIDFKTNDNYGSYVRYDFGRWFPNKDGVLGISGVGGAPEEPGFFHIIPATDTFSHVYSALQNDTFGVPTKPSYFYVARNDVLYTGGYEAGLNGFDLKANTPIFSVENGNQHGMTMVNGKLFGGSYGNDAIYMFDTSKKASSTNPKKVSSTPGLTRYYNTSDTNAGFGLSIGSVDYGNPEGGVILMTYLNSKAQVKFYIGVVPNENIIGVAYKDGYIYAGSSVNVPQHDFHEEAHVAKIDARTGETVKIATVNFEGLPKTTAIGEIRFGPDGLLYGKANVGQTVFALNPEDLSLVKYKSYVPAENPKPGVIGAFMIFGAEGNLYADISGDLYCINIETMEGKKLYGSSSNFCLDNDGNILKRYGTNSLAQYHVNKRQRLEIMIRNASKYYKEEEYSAQSWAVFKNALDEAKAMDIAGAYLPDVLEAARKLSFAIRDLQTVYDYNAGFAFPFK